MVSVVIRREVWPVASVALVEYLAKARRTAPQQTRYHPQVHETVRALARADKRRTDTLANFVGWLGITAASL